MSERLLSVKSVAATLDCSVALVWKLLAAGKFPVPIKLGTMTRWRGSDIDAYILAMCEDQAA